jgi:hypothetical protein
MVTRAGLPVHAECSVDDDCKRNCECDKEKVSERHFINQTFSKQGRGTCTVLCVYCRLESMTSPGFGEASENMHGTHPFPVPLPRTY